MRTLRVVRHGLAFGLALAALGAVTPPADAAPRTPRFGPLIEGYAPYRAQRKCSPRPKPGVVDFRDRVLEAYPWTRDFGIGRNCDVGGISEHKEGRAWDWGVNVAVGRDRRAARDLFDWLFARDRHGNARALTRRLGIMYIVWNRRIWGTWSRRWETYCLERRRGCVDPDDRKVVKNPHTDHVHFSFSRPAARMETSFWRRGLSYP